MPGQPVKYASLGIIESMKFTRLIEHFDTASPPKIGKRANWKGALRKQKRYVIEHLYGFLPSNQPLFNNHEILERLDPSRKYALAYRDELTPLTEVQYDSLHTEQKEKS